MSKRRKQPKTSSDHLQLAITPKFWRSLSVAEVKEIIESGGVLEGAMAERAWRICEMQGPPPARIEIYFDRQQFMDWLDEKFPKAAKKAKERKLQ